MPRLGNCAAETHNHIYVISGISSATIYVRILNADMSTVRMTAKKLIWQRKLRKLKA